MTSPKITVIIPTRERASVLGAALRTVTAQTYENLEIIVSDNNSGDGTDAVVQHANDSRIRYLNTGKRLSMSHNWEFALTHVREGWVTFMGDDDGLLPGAIHRMAEIIVETKAQVIRTEYCTYDWPGMLGRPYGQLIVPLTSGMESRNSRKWLKKALEGHVRYSQLPMIYNGGFIHFSVLQHIRDVMGVFFSSVNPDVYTAVAIARLTDDFLFVREPLAISGTSKYSNGHSAFSARASRNPQAYRQFLSEGNIPSHADMPTSKEGNMPTSLQACVYEAYLQSARLGGSVDSMNHARQLAVVLATSGKHRTAIDAWGQDFSHLHGLDYSRANRSAVHLRRKLESRWLGQKLVRVLRSVVTDRLALQNVYEASIAAGALRAAPGRMDSLRFLGNELRGAWRARINA
ncbi:glycosyltransferase family 2 protein [Luteimonas terricola]|uniref:Glycosyltransferase 2-like domain-containing protein n=1 Tax=Luteimonas terricola TaxID=645597 RepID=A0ABQ2E7F6_9GAMM|nr:glycosyltransferase family 2 protein [Luteimonas terricola]GGJ99584.1 hypothetical protein GCM10011394_05920 [Luteimonas terricola]